MISNDAQKNDEFHRGSNQPASQVPVLNNLFLFFFGGDAGTLSHQDTINDPDSWIMLDSCLSEFASILHHQAEGE